MVQKVSRLEAQISGRSIKSRHNAATTKRVVSIFQCYFLRSPLFPSLLTAVHSSSARPLELGLPRQELSLKIRGAIRPGGRWHLSAALMRLVELVHENS